MAIKKNNHTVYLFNKKHIMIRNVKNMTSSNAKKCGTKSEQTPNLKKNPTYLVGLAPIL